MDNETMKEEFKKIDKMNRGRLSKYIKDIDCSINDPFDDGTDLAGDIALTILKNKASKRLKEV